MDGAEPSMLLRAVVGRSNVKMPFIALRLQAAENAIYRQRNNSIFHCSRQRGRGTCRGRRGTMRATSPGRKTRLSRRLGHVGGRGGRWTQSYFVLSQKRVGACLWYRGVMFFPLMRGVGETSPTSPSLSQTVAMHGFVMGDVWPDVPPRSPNVPRPSTSAPWRAERLAHPWACGRGFRSIGRSQGAAGGLGWGWRRRGRCGDARGRRAGRKGHTGHKLRVIGPTESDPVPNTHPSGNYCPLCPDRPPPPCWHPSMPRSRISLGFSQLPSRSSVSTA